MTIGIPVWNGRVSPLLDTARSLMVVECDAGTEMRCRNIPIPRALPDRLAQFISENGIGTVICDAVSADLSALLLQSGVSVHANRHGRPDQLLREILIQSSH